MNRQSTSGRHVITFPDVSGHKVIGELKLAGRETSVSLFHDGSLPRLETITTLHGELQDFTKVTCLDCVPTSEDRPRSPDGRQARIANLFPHFVVLGNRYLSQQDACIEEITFTVDDIESIFYDFDAFGHVIDAGPLIEAVVKNKVRMVPTGPAPLIAYFSGKYEVISVDTDFGRFSVQHVPRFNMGGPGGVHIKNNMVVRLRPTMPIVFDESIDRIYSLTNFLSAISGRVQAPRKILFAVSGDDPERPERLRLKWSMRPSAARSEGARDLHKPHPGDVPLDPVTRPEEFGPVLKHFVQREPAWHTARARYVTCLRKANFYDIDRLVTAANMFDLLPEDAVPVKPALSPELQSAKKQGLEIFEKLAPGIERDSVISALKRMSKPSLPKKVLHRAAIVQGAVGKSMPDLDVVLKTAVKARNHFVHGGSGEFDFASVEHLSSFLTDALEFTFLASDLIEAGWDVERWFADSHGHGHSLSRFKVEYRHALSELKKALAP